jgi:hypothetical protein
VVVHNINNDLNALPMQDLDHLLELTSGGKRAAAICEKNKQDGREERGGSGEPAHGWPGSMGEQVSSE